MPRGRIARLLAGIVAGQVCLTPTSRPGPQRPQPDPPSRGPRREVAMSAPPREQPQQQQRRPPPSQTQTVPAASGSQTTTQAEAQPAPAVLRLRGAHTASDRSVRWAEDVVNNEGLGRKSSKGSELGSLPPSRRTSADTFPNPQYAASTTARARSTSPATTTTARPTPRPILTRTSAGRRGSGMATPPRKTAAVTTMTTTAPAAMANPGGVAETPTLVPAGGGSPARTRTRRCLSSHSSRPVGHEMSTDLVGIILESSSMPASVWIA